MQDVNTTSKTIASARRLDTVIASPDIEWMDRLFRPFVCTGHRSSVSPLLTRLRVCDPTLSTPVKVRGRTPASHPEGLGVTRLDLLALRLHLGGIGLEQFKAGKRDVLALLLDLP